MPMETLRRFPWLLLGGALLALAWGLTLLWLRMPDASALSLEARIRRDFAAQLAALEEGRGSLQRRADRYALFEDARIVSASIDIGGGSGCALKMSQIERATTLSVFGSSLSWGTATLDDGSRVDIAGIRDETRDGELFYLWINKTLYEADGSRDRGPAVPR